MGRKIAGDRNEDGAMALYLTRYLNVPPARIPGEGRGATRRLACRRGEDPRRLAGRV